MEHSINRDSESLHLLETSNDNKQYEGSTLLPNRRNAFIVLLLILAIVSMVGISSIYAGGETKMETVQEPMSIFVYNEYSGVSAKEDMLPYPFLKDAELMEPYRSNTVMVQGLVDKTIQGCTATWKLSRDEIGTDFVYRGQIEDSDNFIVAPESTGKYILTITPSLECLARTPASFTIWVKYVRRELLALTPQDRDDFLDAFHTLWTVSTKDGRRLYGDKYKSLYYFALIHNDAAGNGICDEFHGGLGFLNNHVYLGAFLEQSLQLVNPKVALHYMDYSKYFESDAFTKDHLSNTMDGGRWSEIMTSTWFGANDPITGRIIDGRWANSPVPFLDSAFFEAQGINEDEILFPLEGDRWYPLQPAHMSSPYGLLRARWNFNPEPYVIRFNNIDRIANAQSMDDVAYAKYSGVGCDNYDLFIQNYAIRQPLEALIFNMEGHVHGPIHFTFGGAGGDRYFAVDQELRQKYGFTDNDIAFTTQLSHAYMKNNAPKIFVGKDSDWNCSFPSIDALKQESTGVDVKWPGETGGVNCDAIDYYYQSDATLNEFIDLFYNMGSSAGAAHKLKEQSFEDKKHAVNLLNSRYQFDGDMATSSAAIDPLFWVQHGAVERLFQRIIMENVLSDRVYTSSDTCSGHDANSPKAWLAGYYFEDKDIQPETLTNAQLIQYLDPTSDLYRDNINFVYDTARFDFCENVEISFAAAAAGKI